MPADENELGMGKLNHGSQPETDAKDFGEPKIDFFSSSHNNKDDTLTKII